MLLLLLRLETLGKISEMHVSGLGGLGKIKIHLPKRKWTILIGENGITFIAIFHIVGCLVVDFGHFLWF